MELKNYLEAIKPAVLDLGCGGNKQPGAFGIDTQEFRGVDMVHNLEDGIPSENETFDVVLAQDFLEHIIPQKNIFVMEEIYRVLKIGGKLKFMVPTTDWGGMGAFQDPTHYSFWNQHKFKYFCKDGFRQLYDVQCWFKTESIETYINQWNVPYCRGVLKKDTP